MRIQYLLWDFGDTLCDEQSLWRVSPEWMAVYGSFAEADGIGAAWCRGDLDIQQMAQQLARRMSLSELEILAHLSRTDLFAFFPFTYAFFRAQHLPQALVTVNPAEFRTMARKLALDECVESIVISGEEGIIDKGALCEIALQRMGLADASGKALLIDNKPDNLAAWAARGGPGYWYTGDEAFARDVAEGIDGLVHD